MKKTLDFIKVIISSLAVIVGLLLLQTICMVIIGIFFNIDTENASFSPVVLALGSIIYGVIAFVILLLGYRRMTINDKDADSFKTELSAVILIILIGISLSFFLSSALNYLYVLFGDSYIFADYSELIDKLNGNETPLIFLYTLLLAPVTEELTYRGVVSGFLKKAVNKKAVNIIQAFLFSFVHFQLIQSVYAFFAGLLFGYIKDKRKNIFEVIILHITVNISGIAFVPKTLDIIAVKLGNDAGYLMACAVSGILMFLSIRIMQKKRVVQSE